MSYLEGVVRASACVVLVCNYVSYPAVLYTADLQTDPPHVSHHFAAVYDVPASSVVTISDLYVYKANTAYTELVLMRERKSKTVRA